VTNAGPDLARLARIEAHLPNGVALQSLAGIPGAVLARGQLYAPIGTLPAGGSTSLVVRLSLATEGTLNLAASVTSGLLDPALSNNVAAIQIPVGEGIPLRVVQVGSNLELSWPETFAGAVPEVANSILRPVWSVVPGEASTSNGRRRLLIPLDGDIRFYRLRQP
jgi:hypothetical protein